MSKKIYLSIFALIISIVGVFGLCFQRDNIISVNADTVSSEYSFYGRGFQVYSTLYSFGSTSPSVDNVVSSNFYNFQVDWLTAKHFQLSLNYDTFYNSIAHTVENYIHDSWEFVYIRLSNLGIIMVHYFIETGFNADVKYIDLQSDRWAGVNEDIAQTQFQLVDSNGKVAHFYVFGNYNAWYPTSTSRNYSHYSYEPRRYYLTGNLTDNDFYSTGYNNGYSVGEQQGYNDGMQQGYDTGYNAGKNVGFDEGVASANDYSFLGLLGSVVDAPLNMFVQTFDFNVLGFNMKDFFLSILTIALIFTIIRLCMGGKS